MTFKDELRAELARGQREQAREALRKLRASLEEARATRARRVARIRRTCSEQRQALRSEAQRLREQVARVAAERRLLRETCREAVKDTRAESEQQLEDRRGMLAAERLYQLQARERVPAKPRRTAAETRAESDGEVAANIDPAYLPIWQKMRRKIRGNQRMSRTEAFLQWIEEHPHEADAIIEEDAVRALRELERKERAASKRAQVLDDDVPF